MVDLRVSFHEFMEVVMYGSGLSKALSRFLTLSIFPLFLLLMISGRFAVLVYSYLIF